MHIIAIRLTRSKKREKLQTNAKSADRSDRSMLNRKNVAHFYSFPYLCILKEKLSRKREFYNRIFCNQEMD